MKRSRRHALHVVICPGADPADGHALLPYATTSKREAEDYSALTPGSYVHKIVAYKGSPNALRREDARND